MLMNLLKNNSAPRSYSYAFIIVTLLVFTKHATTLSLCKARLSPSAINRGSLFTTWSRNRAACVLKLADNDQNDKKSENRKNNDDNRSEKLGGTSSSRKLFALTEIFGRITSVFGDNSDDKGSKISTLEQEIDLLNVESRVLTTPRTAEDVEKIAAQIKKEYEAIFWAVSLI